MFKKKKYEVVRQPFSKILIDFLFKYFLVQRNAVAYLLRENKINAFNPFIGNFEETQVPDCYAKYGDWAMDTFSKEALPLMEQKTGLKLVPTFTYARAYTKGNILWRHSDRNSCEVSTTINLGGDLWPLYIDPTGTQSVIKSWFGEKGEECEVKPNAPTGVRVDLKPGDMMIYAGCDLEHWREKFEGELCVQLFLHYNDVNGPLGKTNFQDGRPVLGISKYKKMPDPQKFHK